MITLGKEALISHCQRCYAQNVVFNTPMFIPHMWSSWKDIEISAFFASWAWHGTGPRPMANARFVTDIFSIYSPHRYIIRREYDRHLFTIPPERIQGMLFSLNEIYSICERLNMIYRRYGTILNSISKTKSHPLEALVERFEGVARITDYPNNSQFLLNLFLKTVIRENDGMDIGLWKGFDKRNLIIPLNSRVLDGAKCFFSLKAGALNIKTAKKITENLLDVYPEDPCKAFPAFLYEPSKW